MKSTNLENTVQSITQQLCLSALRTHFFSKGEEAYSQVLCSCYADLYFALKIFLIVSASSIIIITAKFNRLR